MFLNLVQSSKNSQVTLSDLDFFRFEKAALRDSKEGYRKTHLDIIRYIIPNWTGRLSIKALNNLCEVYEFLVKSSRHVLKIRTSEACDEINHNNLREAIIKYNALRIKRLELGSRIQLDIDPSILKQSISVLKNCGIFSWLKKEVRDVKKTFRDNSIGNINCSLQEMLILFEQLQCYKLEYMQFIQEPRYALFLNALEKIGESRLEELVDLIDWSAKINQLLKGNNSLLVAIKRYFFDSDLSHLDSFIQICENIDFKQCLKDLSIQNPLSFIDDQIDILDKEIENLDRLRNAAMEVGYRPDILLEKAKNAYKLYCSLIEMQERIKTSTQQLYDRSKILEAAIELCKKLGLKTTSETFSIPECIRLIEQCEFLKEQAKKQEDLLFSKKCQIKRFDELCHTSLLCRGIPFDEVKDIVKKLQVLQLAISSLPQSETFSFIYEVSDANALTAINSSGQLYLDLTSKGISQPLIRYVQSEDVGARLNELQIRHSQLLEILPEALSELECILKDGEINSKIWFGNGFAHECSLSDVIDKFENVHMMREHLQEWIELKNLEDKLEQYGIKTLCALILHQKIDLDLIPIAIEFVFYQSIITSIQQEHSIVNQVDYHDLNSLRQRFAEIDQQLIGLYRKLAAAKIMERTVDPGTKKGSRREWTGKALIELEVAKQRKHRPIRELLVSAGEAMQSLKPCFMMSPLSVVQYLAPGNLKFDLIIIDEASQVKPEDAIGTLARGKQIIIVGDPKQLPPTDFWKKGSDFEDDEEEHEDIGNEESILDLAATIYQPMRRLRWHYRSQHESLINFSNKEFYDNNLIIFPSPNFGDGKLGLSYQFVEDAQYLRGGDKINSEEAGQLVNAVEIFMRDHPDRSIGIVTMNVPQRELINEMMNARFSESTIAEEYRAQME